MSSNQIPRDGKKNRKMTSIVRKLEWQMIRVKIWLFSLQDVAMAAVLFVGWAAMKEMEVFGAVLAEGERAIVGNGSFSRACYVVKDAAGEVLLSERIQPVWAVIGSILGVWIFFQLVHIALAARAERFRIQKSLEPIFQLAIQADELSRISFDEQRLHELESAIDSIQPEDNEPIQLRDTELRGIEMAVNNLLVRLRDSYRQQARFVNDASHELRTPIAVIQGYANMLKRWGREDEKVLEESITAIAHEADHMNILVEQLLFLARGDSGRTTLALEELNLTAMMQEVYEESFLIDEKHPYRFRKEDADVVIQGDPTLLKQAVRILIDNAAKYTKEGDEIILGVGRQEGRPYLMVQDTGIGMCEQDVAHMFERFYRADEARSYSGTGLGLSIAKWIVDKHGGHFEIVSRTELGTRIRIVL
ncbi:MAG: HAMP domain-containing histidine kinase [Lachnospiraceae bacterium]|nr:HAMP domain-containing histidine kinase [Lachnospiraceae bacterium]